MKNFDESLFLYLNKLVKIIKIKKHVVQLLPEVGGALLLSFISSGKRDLMNADSLSCMD